MYHNSYTFSPIFKLTIIHFSVSIIITAQPNAKQRENLRRINRAGFGITDSEAREIARKDRR